MSFLPMCVEGIQVNIQGLLVICEALACMPQTRSLPAVTGLSITHTVHSRISGSSCNIQKLRDQLQHAIAKLREQPVLQLHLPALREFSLRLDGDGSLAPQYVMQQAIDDFIPLLGATNSPQVCLQGVVISAHPLWHETAVSTCRAFGAFFNS